MIDIFVLDLYLETQLYIIMRFEIKYSETIYRNFLAEKIAKELLTLGKSLLSGAKFR